MALTVVLDVNETLLDLAGLDEPLAAAFGEHAAPGVKQLWFARLLHLSAVVTITGQWQDFGVLGRAALVSLGEERGVDLSAAQIDAVLDAMRTLPPYREVPGALRRLRDAGIAAVALTNSPQAAAEAKLFHAGLAGELVAIMSVDGVRRFKPHPAVYELAAAQMGVPLSDIVMVAAHDWDCAGAMAAGAEAAFVARPGRTWSPALPRPTYQGGDLSAVVDAVLVARA